ncbi:PEP-CTERM sorting domain-containing protein [Massilia sp. YMA4]|uniref:PEP-CTERM sorting domain-containing protein n=1 Tax=Massilia sp. YMA4 TaxID=1593482 RepID=UPI000DD16C08|nr:PEP-CTERM sorting domain-containing protein [Massilia sp. YMA4]AXA91979.1 hypothetical protein DPH57_12975 [Massilia sp. YMA4]
MKTLLASLSLALACAAVQGAEPVPVTDRPGLTQADDTPAAADTSAATAANAPSPATAVPEPGVLPMLAIGIVLVVLRLGRKGRNDTFK